MRKMFALGFAHFLIFKGMTSFNPFKKKVEDKKIQLVWHVWSNM